MAPQAEGSGLKSPNYKVRSPTSLSSSGQRPKSSRRAEHQGSKQGFLAAESFQKAYDGKDPTVRGTSYEEVEPIMTRRSYEEMGHFRVEEEKSGSPGGRFMGEQDKSGIPGLLVAFNQNATACMNLSMNQSKQYADRYGPIAKQNLTACASNTKEVAGEGWKDFTMTAAEVYRQECKMDDNRGGDAAFFMETTEKGDIDKNSLMDGKSNDERGGEFSGQVQSKSTRRKRFPEAIHIKDPVADVDISPKRKDRRRKKKVEAKEPGNYLQQTANLRETRMELFKKGEDLSDPEVRLSRALEDINRQDQLIAGLKRQLGITQENLDETIDELTRAKQVSQDSHFKATEIQARALQERKRLEDMYEQESETNRKMQSNLAQLHSEISTLRMTLQKSKGEAPSNDGSFLTPQVIALRAEIVELRYQLAEAHAANDDNSSLNTYGEMDEIRNKLRETEWQLRALQDKDLDVRKLEEKHRQEERLLKEKIQKLEAAARENEAQLQEKYESSLESENDVRSEMIKMKANLQRLERERSRNRLHSSADVDRLNKQLILARDAASKSKQLLVNEQKAAREESSKLKKELEELKREMAISRKEINVKSEESLRGQKWADPEPKDYSHRDGRAGLRLKAVEQSYANQIRVLKSRLNEGEAKVKEEKYRADEERRMSRESETKRTEELRRLRQANEQVKEEKSRLEDEIYELKTRLASTSLGDVSSVSSKTEKSADSAVPENVRRLRNELALARARLSAARDQSRSIDERSRYVEQGVEESTRGKRFSSGGTDNDSANSGESAGSSWAPFLKKDAEQVLSPSQVVLHKAASSLRTPPRSITRRGNNSGSQDLELQLEQSSKRLERANSRLKGLVG